MCLWSWPGSSILCLSRREDERANPNAKETPSPWRFNRLLLFFIVAGRLPMYNLPPLRAGAAGPRRPPGKPAAGARNLLRDNTLGLGKPFCVDARSRAGVNRLSGGQADDEV